MIADADDMSDFEAVIAVAKELFARSTAPQGTWDIRRVIPSTAGEAVKPGWRVTDLPLRRCPPAGFTLIGATNTTARSQKQAMISGG